MPSLGVQLALFEKSLGFCLPFLLEGKGGR
jgi:hypothetical protein